MVGGWGGGGGKGWGGGLVEGIYDEEGWMKGKRDCGGGKVVVRWDKE